jgi:hypothetical protein
VEDIAKADANAIALSFMVASSVGTSHQQMARRHLCSSCPIATPGLSRCIAAGITRQDANFKFCRNRQQAFLGKV